MGRISPPHFSHSRILTMAYRATCPRTPRASGLRDVKFRLGRPASAIWQKIICLPSASACAERAQEQDRAQSGNYRASAKPQPETRPFHPARVARRQPERQLFRLDRKGRDPRNSEKCVERHRQRRGHASAVETQRIGEDQNQDAASARLRPTAKASETALVVDHSHLRRRWSMCMPAVLVMNMCRLLIMVPYVRS